MAKNVHGSSDLDNLKGKQPTGSLTEDGGHTSRGNSMQRWKGMRLTISRNTGEPFS